MKIYTICGSFKFTDVMIEEAERLTLEGNCILTPTYIFKRHLYNVNTDKLIESHNKKIEMSDGIYVIDVDGYIGADTQREIEYAKMLNKEIKYYSKEIQ